MPCHTEGKTTPLCLSRAFWAWELAGESIRSRWILSILRWPKWAPHQSQHQQPVQIALWKIFTDTEQTSRMGRNKCILTLSNEVFKYHKSSIVRLCATIVYTEQEEEFKHGSNKYITSSTTQWNLQPTQIPTIPWSFLSSIQAEKESLNFTSAFIQSFASSSLLYKLQRRHIT